MKKMKLRELTHAASLCFFGGAKSAEAENLVFVPRANARDFLRRRTKTALFFGRLTTFLWGMLFAGAALAQQSGQSGWNPSNFSNTGLPSGSIYGIISAVLYWILGIFGFIAIIGFVISGIMYLTAAGDDDQQERAKDQMKWSIIGVIVGLAGLVVIYAANNLLNAASNF